MSAPIWRFTLSPGLAGPAAMLGVLMPSVDRVGRLFPLTLVTTIATDPVAAHREGGVVFSALEQIALDMLEDSASRESLAAALAAMVPPVPMSLPKSGLDTAAPDRALKRPSVWSALLEDKQSSVAFEGLPRPEDTVNFFDPAATRGERFDVLGLSA